MGMFEARREDYPTSSTVLENTAYLLQVRAVKLGPVEGLDCLQDTPDSIKHCISDFQGVCWHF